VGNSAPMLRETLKRKTRKCKRTDAEQSDGPTRMSDEAW
jgi:hypothetical protein